MNNEIVNNMVSAIRAATQQRALETLDKLLGYHPVNVGDGDSKPGIWLAEDLAAPGKPYALLAYLTACAGAGAFTGGRRVKNLAELQKIRDGLIPLYVAGAENGS